MKPAPPEDEFDHVEDTGELPGRGRQRLSEAADLRLLREAIQEQGKMLGEIESKFLSQAEDMLKLHERCRRNAHNIRVLALKLGLRVDGEERTEGRSLAPLQPKASSEEEP